MEDHKGWSAISGKRMNKFNIPVLVLRIVVMGIPSIVWLVSATISDKSYALCEWLSEKLPDPRKCSK